MDNLHNEEVTNLAKNAMRDRHQVKEFIPGTTSVPVTGKVYGSEEIAAAIEASLDSGLQQVLIQKNLKEVLQK